MPRTIDPNRIPLVFASLLLVAAFTGGCDSADETGFPAGLYEVTLQIGSSLDERPECLGDSLLIADVVALYDGLTHFEIAAVDEFGEPASEEDASYWGFIMCGSADCSEDPYGYEAYPLLGSPAVDSLTGTSEMLSFGYSETEQTAECLRIVFTSQLVLDEENQSVHFEFTNEMVFEAVDYDPDTLEQAEEECFSNPPELGEDPCTRLEILEGVLIE